MVVVVVVLVVRFWFTDETMCLYSGGGGLLDPRTATALPFGGCRWSAVNNNNTNDRLLITASGDAYPDCKTKHTPIHH